MKERIMRVLLVSAMLLSITEGLFAEAESGIPVNRMHKEFMVQGGFNAVTELSVEPLDTVGQNYIYGMPFNLCGPDVAPDVNGYGRLICTWSLLSNSPYFEITVEADNLRHTTAPDDPKRPEIRYELTFVTELSYESYSQIAAMPFEFTVLSGVPNRPVEAPFTEDDMVTPDTFIGCTDGKIYFRLRDEMPTESTHISERAGSYMADVKIVFRMKE